MKSITTSSIVALLLLATSSEAQDLSLTDVQDYDASSGIGCLSQKPVTKKADYYFICRSKISEEQAWDAAIYRSKVACSSDEISVHFNVSPGVPPENGIFGAQIEVSCGKKT